MLPLISPLQSAPVLSPPSGVSTDIANAIQAALFSRTWFLFLQNLPDGISSMVKYGTEANRKGQTAVLDGALFFETDTNSIYQWRNTGDTPGWNLVIAGSTSGSTTIITLSLTTALTNIDAPGSGSELVYFLDQDGTGGRAVHWRTGFGYTSDNLGDMTPNSRSTFRYQRDPGSGLFILSSQPVLDMMP